MRVISLRLLNISELVSVKRWQGLITVFSPLMEQLLKGKESTLCVFSFFLKLLYVLKSSRMGELGGVPIHIARSFSL